MSRVVELKSADDPRDVIHQAVQQLSEGRLVCLPTETMYTVACDALNPDGLAEIGRLQQQLPGSVCCIALQDAQAAWDYLPQMSELGKRFCRRCWPGPLILSFASENREGLTVSLPDAAQQLVIDEGYLRLWIPADMTFQSVCTLTANPLVLLSLTNVDEIPCIAQDAERIYGEKVALIIDAGSSRYCAPATEVRVDQDRWDVSTESIVKHHTIQNMASQVYLFVCTGNTCRSPMAEGMFRKMLAERLKCAPEELEDRGYIVLSAGIAAGMGGRASPESVEVMQARGIDLNQHASHPLTGQLLQAADHIYTMTNGHRDSILYEAPTAEDRVSVLSREGLDISDPIGYGIDKYQQCADEIERALQSILADLPQD